MSRVIELTWNCGDCSAKGILGRHKRCPGCGSPREKGEMKMTGLATDRDGDGYNDAETVTDSALLKLAQAGADWFCTHCGSGNIGDGDRCDSCGSPRYGEAEEDHPAFKGAHKKVYPWEEEWEPKISSPKILESTVRDQPSPFHAAWEGENTGREHRGGAFDWKRVLFVGGGIMLLVLVIGFLIWAFQTHEVMGTVDRMTWSQNTVVQTWTPVDVRLWKHETRERAEIPPVKGSGERAGTQLVGGCRQEHHHYEKYQCGTRQESYDCSYSESYSDTCTRTEQYACGETCRDNGNGFATCTTRYCSRQVSYSCTKSRRVPKTCERTVPKYCSRSIEKTRCTYRTQEWTTTRTLPASGVGRETRWPEYDPQPLDRILFTSDYTVFVRYEDRGKEHTYKHKPVPSTHRLGERRLLSRSKALEAERSYRKWHPGEEVTVIVNNLGGIHSVRHGTEIILTGKNP